MTLQFTDVNDAFPDLLHRVLTQGHLVDSRNGKTRELTMQQITLTDPTVKELTVPGRRVSLPAQIAETMWILAGRNDVEWLSHYLPRAAEFADDGQHWRGGYGPRLRSWGDGTIDQLEHIVNLLKEDPESRRAIFTIYDPAIDSAPGKDIPCNNWVHFLPREGTLHAHVAIRSNDLFWGWSGINAFEWTSLLQVVSALTGLERGSITFSISSLHLYEHHWERAESIVNGWTTEYAVAKRQGGPAFDLGGRSLEDFDDLVEDWFRIEGQIRKGGLSTALIHQVGNFPEPMMRSWLQVLLAWHHDDMSLIETYRGTELYEATANSPKRKKTTPVMAPTFKTAPERIRFTVFATKLHAEKNAAYGDSWKKRGEMLGIMANIARKVDRLGVPGGGDTAADTAIDMLVYLIKYNLWLRQQAGAMDAPTEGKSHVSAVDLHLQHLEQDAPYLDALRDELLIGQIRETFDVLEHLVEEKRASRNETVLALIHLAYPLAVRLWTREGQSEGAALEAWQKGNETRFFNGYSFTEEAK